MLEQGRKATEISGLSFMFIVALFMISWHTGQNLTHHRLDECYQVKNQDESKSDLEIIFQVLSLLILPMNRNLVFVLFCFQRWG